MNSTRTESSISIILNSHELWTIAKHFGPGLIFGVDDPTEGLTEEEINAAEIKAYHDLNAAGLLVRAESGNPQIDEILGGMVYSCIHSRDLLVLKSPSSNIERFYHFLPEWQMELCQVKDGYQLTLFKERKDLFEHILAVSGAKLNGQEKKLMFVTGARDLELAAFMYDTGKKASALEILPSDKSSPQAMKNFLSGYLSPEFHLIFEMLYARDDEIQVHNQRNELLQTDDGLFWLSHHIAGEESMKIIDLQAVTADQAKENFNKMLPKN